MTIEPSAWVETNPPNTVWVRNSSIGAIPTYDDATITYDDVTVYYDGYNANIITAEDDVYFSAWTDIT